MSGRSVARYTWLDKLKRVGELSASSPDMKFNNLGHLVGKESLIWSFNRLDGTKAVGVDKQNKEQYGIDLDSNLNNLIVRIRKGNYRPKPARVTYIPKADGDLRPLAISCVEDKVVQTAVTEILTAIYEPLFLPCSYGFRPGKGCHDAIKELSSVGFKSREGHIVEIDIRKYFPSISHEVILDILAVKISDRKFLQLVKTLLQTPTTKDGLVTENLIGAPQGSVLSPIIGNILLHQVLDVWFEEVNKSHFGNRAKQIRYVDDAVYIFDNERDARRFLTALPKRLGRFGLSVHEEKTQILPFGFTTAKTLQGNGLRMPTFNFLGFTWYWGLVRNGTFFRLRVKSRADRLRAKLKGLKRYLRENLNTRNMFLFLKSVIRVVKGWVNYHAVSDNQRSVNGFLRTCKRALFRWFNRRGGRRRMTWERFRVLLKRVQFPETYLIMPLFQTPKTKRLA